MEVHIGGGAGGGASGASGGSGKLTASSSSSALFGSGSARRHQVSLAQLVLLNAVVCGLEFCASAAFTYIPPMLLKSGIPEQRMSVVLGIGPLLGFLLVPIIGRSSDRCKSSFGRRRPFILGLSLLLILSLAIIPYGEMVAIYVFGAKSMVARAAGVWMLIIGAVMLDFTSQVTLTPCEALLSDACTNSNQEERGFMVYSFMVSLGGCIGYLITALDWNSNSVGVYFGGQEQSAFSVLIVLFTLTLIATLMIAQESPNLGQSPSSPPPPPPPLQQPSSVDIATKLDDIHRHIVRHKQLNGVLPVPAQDPGYESDSNRSMSEENMILHFPEDPCEDAAPSRPSISSSSSPTTSSSSSSSSNPLCPVFVSQHLCHIPLTRWSILNYQSFCYLLSRKLYRLLPSNLTILFDLPLVLRRLALANFFSWTAIMSFNLFYTDYVGQMIYGGHPDAPPESVERALYDEGVRMGSWGLFFHCVTSAMYAGCVERLVRRYGMRATYLLGMMTFSAAMFFMVMSRSLLLVNLMAAVTGLGYATLTTIPFMLVNTYHSSAEIYYFDQKQIPGAVHGIGSDISSLDSAYFLSQVILSALMGSVVHMVGSVVTYIVVAGAMGALACACVSRLVVTRAQVATEMLLLLGRAGDEGRV